MSGETNYKIYKKISDAIVGTVESDFDSPYSAISYLSQTNKYRNNNYYVYETNNGIIQEPEIFRFSLLDTGTAYYVFQGAKSYGCTTNSQHAINFCTYFANSIIRSDGLFAAEGLATDNTGNQPYAHTFERTSKGRTLRN